MTDVRIGRLVVVVLCVLIGGCGGPGDQTGEALLSVEDEAGLYEAVSAEVAGPLPFVLDAGWPPDRFIVVDRPVPEVASFEAATTTPFADEVRDAIERGLGGAVMFVSDPAEAMVEGAYEVPVTTNPGDSGPSSQTVSGLVAPEGAALVQFSPAYLAWGGGFTGGEWPSDAEMSVDVNYEVYLSPTTSWGGAPGVELRAGVWSVAGQRTMGTPPSTEPGSQVPTVTGITRDFEVTWESGFPTGAVRDQIIETLVSRTISTLLPTTSPDDASGSSGRLAIFETFPTGIVSVDVVMKGSEWSLSLSSIAASQSEIECDQRISSGTSSGLAWERVEIRNTDGCRGLTEPDRTLLEWEEAGHRFHVEGRMPLDSSIDWLEMWELVR